MRRLAQRVVDAGARRGGLLLTVVVEVHGRNRVGRRVRGTRGGAVPKRRARHSSIAARRVPAGARQARADRVESRARLIGRAGYEPTGAMSRARGHASFVPRGQATEMRVSGEIGRRTRFRS